MWHRGNNSSHLPFLRHCREARIFNFSKICHRDCQIGFLPAYVTLKFDSSNFKSVSVFLAVLAGIRFEGTFWEFHHEWRLNMRNLGLAESYQGRKLRTAFNIAIVPRMRGFSN